MPPRLFRRSLYLGPQVVKRSPVNKVEQVAATIVEAGEGGGTVAIVTTGAAGLAPQLSGVGSQYLDGTGAYSVPAGGGGGSTTPIVVAADTALTTDTGWVVPEALEIAAGVILEIEDGARLEITGDRLRGTYLLEMDATQKQVANESAEQTLYTYTVPAGLLGLRRALRLCLQGRWVNNTGSNRTLRLRILFGGVAVYDDVSLSIGTNTQAFPWKLDLVLANRGATNAQIVAGAINFGAYGTAAPDVGVGAIQQDVGGATSYVDGLIQGNGAIDTTAAAALAVLVTLSTNSVSLSISRELTTLELVAA